MKPSFFLLFILLLLPLASAADGCFLYADSPSFCQEISKEQAQEECDFFNRCEIRKVFLENQFCQNQKQCQKILCQSNCQQEFLGQCPAGAVTDPQWCTAGCCQFEYSGEKFCSFKPSKNRCVLEVQNRDVTFYRFSSTLDKNTCEQSCAQGKTLLVEEEAIGIPKQSSTSEPSSTISSPPSAPSSPKSPQSPPSSPAPQKISLSLILFLLLITIVLVLIFFLFWKHAHRRPQAFSYELSAEELAERQKIPWFFPFTSYPWIKERIERSKKFRRHKLQHHQREEFLAESGLSPEKKIEKPKDDPFRKLQKLAKKAKPEGKSPLQVLEEMGKK